VHTIRIVHRDEVEPPVTRWLEEAYVNADPQASPAARPTSRSRAPARSKARARRPAPARSRRKWPA